MSFTPTSTLPAHAQASQPEILAPRPETLVHGTGDSGLSRKLRYDLRRLWCGVTQNGSVMHQSSCTASLGHIYSSPCYLPHCCSQVMDLVVLLAPRLSQEGPILALMNPRVSLSCPLPT